MEKADSHRMFSKTYPKVKFYKEDIEELTNLFAKNFNKIELEADGYKLENVSEIKNLHKEEIFDFSLSGYDDDYLYKICLSMRKESISLYVRDIENINYLGIVSKIDSIISKRVRLANILNSRWAMYIGLVFCLIFYYFVNKSSKITDKLSATIIFPILLVFILHIIENMLNYNVFILKYYKDSPNFYKKNKDNIFVGIICTVVGGVIGGLLIYIITK